MCINMHAFTSTLISKRQRMSGIIKYNYDDIIIIVLYPRQKKTILNVQVSRIIDQRLKIIDYSYMFI